MNTFKVVLKNGLEFTSTGQYVDLAHLYNNAWMHEGALVCDEAIVSIQSIDYIVVVKEEK